MKELDKCIKFLKDNGYIKLHDNLNDCEEYQTMCKDNNEVMGIDLNEDEIVFISDEGDWLHIPCNYYALIGACIHYSQLGVGYKH